ncbi:metallophosphoesterase [Thermococcus sp. M39]|uniref:metallophosphoesterase n=1 Tax=unclassified Thermococcus TaxID=2627626 RepID=UPI001439C7E9|nr:MULTISPECIES: metallophosphoesterase [unclassified Thermococcus]NJE07177.1 metallophosphoesterase [Thermococcus sp. M39]NJE12691.1 metallophosphoesterase [Thermococcus sp. LS2]
MLIGIMSDTHDNLPAIAKAVELFNREKVDLVIHAGDYVAPFVKRELSKLKAPLKGVFGNNDGERRGLNKALGISEEVLEIDADGMRIIVLHGTNEKVVEAFARSQLYDVIVRGHTHKYEIRETGRSILVNPGEVCGYLTGIKSIAFLDTKKREIKIINLDTEEPLGFMSL